MGAGHGAVFRAVRDALRCECGADRAGAGYSARGGGEAAGSRGVMQFQIVSGFRRAPLGIGACVCVVVAVSALFLSAGTSAAQEPKNNVRKAHYSTTPVGAPTVDEASKFLADAEARLLDLSTKGQRAAWVQENFITEDTEQIAADASQALNALSVDLAKK